MYDPAARYRAQKSEQRTMLLFFAAVAAFFVLFNWSEREDFTLSATECTVLNQLWTRKYRDDFAFTENWSGETFACNSQHSGLVRALKFIDDIQPESDGDEEFNFYQWARAQNATIDRDLLFSLAGKALFEERRIVINDSALLDNNTLAIAGILVHELRHLEEGFNSHVPCSAEPGRKCDQRLEANPRNGGAYSFNMFFFSKVRQSARATRFEKKMARKQMQAILNRSFNQTPAGAPLTYDLDALN